MKLTPKSNYYMEKKKPRLPKIKYPDNPDVIQCVEDFFDYYGLDRWKEPTFLAAHLTRAMTDLRHELDDMDANLSEGELLLVVEGAVNMLFELLCTLHELGMPTGDLFKEKYRASMELKDAENPARNRPEPCEVSRPADYGKVLRAAGYSGPVGDEKAQLDALLLYEVYQGDQTARDKTLYQWLDEGPYTFRALDFIAALKKQKLIPENS